MSKDIASDMRWNKEKRVDAEGVFNHPADTEEWKDFDKQYTWFAKGARNIRLGLATGGFNPLESQATHIACGRLLLCLIICHLKVYECGLFNAFVVDSRTKIT